MKKEVKSLKSRKALGKVRVADYAALEALRI